MAHHPESPHHFHQILVQNLMSRQDPDLNSALTVAEIYRDLVPPPISEDESEGTHQDGYGLILLRLLAGEGGFVQMESESAHRLIQAQLASPKPDLALYRDLAKVKVRLNPERLETTASNRMPASGD